MNLSIMESYQTEVIYGPEGRNTIQLYMLKAALFPSDSIFTSFSVLIYV